MKHDILLEIKKLNKSFDVRINGLVARIRGGNVKVYAVDDINFTLKKGEILGLIGESGCGKSTTARLIMRLLSPDRGCIEFKGKDIKSIRGVELKEFRQKVQMVFQDPYEYLNPRINLLEIITEPLLVNKMVKDSQEREKIAIEMLETVGLIPGKSYLYRFSHELSGGQRQRVAIARALVLNPELIIADEPTSMLDVSVRAGILNLLIKLKKERQMSMVFITHDIATAGYMCNRIAVMYKGRIVEIGEKNEIIFNPHHPYTKALVSVAMDLNKFLEEKDDLIRDGEVNAMIKNKFCSFEDRCTIHGIECENSQPDLFLKQVEDKDHFVACCKATW